MQAYTLDKREFKVDQGRKASTEQKAGWLSWVLSAVLLGAKFRCQPQAGASCWISLAGESSSVG